MLYATPAIVACVGAFLYFAGEEKRPASLTGSVQTVGSESLRPSVTACAEDFMTRNPQTDIVVGGGGSGDGIAALLHGIADIAMASRELSQREREYARSKAIELAQFPLALDGVSIIVNRANPVTDLGHRLHGSRRVETRRRSDQASCCSSRRSIIRRHGYTRIDKLGTLSLEPQADLDHGGSSCRHYESIY